MSEPLALYPVIMCGGSGTRLWPASRASRPKQFLPLLGERSLFQETVLRVAPLAKGEGSVVVVAGVAHERLVIDQLGEIGVTATIILEPEPRDSAPAMGAAAVWITGQDPDGIAVFVASDHHIPDAAAFRDAASQAAIEAHSGKIVTLGVYPSTPSPAFGYIRPKGPGLAAVDAFVEKPDAETAAGYVASGYLWNSGNFIVGAQVLIDEINAHTPDILVAVREGLPTGAKGAVIRLGPRFRHAPRISIDYAVMERTARASVLPIAFAWSDVGSWDAVAELGLGARGKAATVDAPGCLVCAPEGVLVAVVGLPNIAVIVEHGVVLVCDLAQAQSVKALVDQVRTISPSHLDPGGPPE